MKHMSQSVQASSTSAYFSFGTPSSSPVGPLSIRSNSRGKESHRLKQRRQPWQMSKTRSISFSRAASSQNQGSCQPRGKRTGASRLPSRMVLKLLGQRRNLSRDEKGDPRGSPFESHLALGHRVEGLLEAAGVALLSLRQRLEPVGDLAEAFFARSAGHARVHVGVLVRLAGNCGLEVVVGWADREASGRIAAHLEELEMTVRVAGFAFGGRAEHDGDIVVAFDVGLLCEVQVTAVGLALAGERCLQVAFGLRSLEICHRPSPLPSTNANVFTARILGSRDRQSSSLEQF